jgi:cytosine/adenosine deaminase-related metal-dependent hydrolase
VLLRARTVLPVCAPPIVDGAVLVVGERIARVGRWEELRHSAGAEVFDLGQAVLLPGLINAHCHLDYTDMAGLLSPAKHFSDWIKAIVSLKATWSYTDYANSWLRGAKMLLHSGTTTVVNIEAIPELLPDLSTSTPVRVISCLELLSLRKRQRNREAALQLVGEAELKLTPLPAEAVGLSPHAPYSTSQELLQVAAQSARQRGWLFTTHVSESADEFEMFQQARGPMYEWLKPQRDMSDCDGRSPVDHLFQSRALGRNCLAVHVNYLAVGDAVLLAQSRSSVVHCPRSHAYFQHQPFPLTALADAGVNLCLGTDSMATMLKSRTEPMELNLFTEMQLMGNTFPALRSQSIVEMVTLNAAKALGRAHELGCLAPGAWADLIALPLPRHVRDPYDAVLDHCGQVQASIIRGAWAISPPS